MPSVGSVKENVIATYQWLQYVDNHQYAISFDCTLQSSSAASLKDTNESFPSINKSSSTGFVKGKACIVAKTNPAASLKDAPEMGVSSSSVSELYSSTCTEKKIDS